MAEARGKLLAGCTTFAALTRELGLSIQPADIEPVGNLVTPAFSPIRFDTTFFLTASPEGQFAEVWPGELSEGQWLDAGEALDRWAQAQLLIAPPSVAVLQVIRGQPLSEFSERIRGLSPADDDTVPPIFFSPAVRLLPLPYAGLPPATHTNAYLIGTGPTWLLDPACTDPTEQQRLFDVLDQETADGRKLAGVILSHHHPDHIGAASACATRFSVPILAHAETSRLLTGKVRIDRFLQDGEPLDLGLAPHGRGRWHLETMLTPGHAPGHLSFYQPDYGLLFVGDMVSTLSSVIIVPPEGDIALYLNSLHRLLAKPARLLLPGHGPVSARPAYLIKECIENRVKRERQLIEILTPAPRTLEELTLELYRGLPDNLMPLAQGQTAAGLEKLRREGRVLVRDQRWEMKEA